MEYTQTHKDKQRTALLGVLNDQKFTDTTFIIGVDKDEYNVNRLFLAMVSPVFEAMLFGQMRESELNSVVIIENMEPKVFECILNFAYCNDPNITQENVLKLYQAADKYQMRTLLDWCDEYIRSGLIINEENLCSFLNEAVKMKQQKVMDFCFEYMRRADTSSSKIISSDTFKTINQKAMREILEKDVLDVEEEKLWNHVVSWAEFQSRSETQNVASIKNEDDDNKKNDDDVEPEKDPKVKILRSVSDLIRFGAMSGVYFTKHVIPENVLSKDDIIAVMIYFQTPDAGCGKFKTAPRSKREPNGDYNLKYRLEMSSKHTKPAAGILNTYEALISRDLTKTCSTGREIGGKQSWIECHFDRLVHINSIAIGPAKIINHTSKEIFGAKFLKGVDIYFKEDSNWVLTGSIKEPPEGEIATVKNPDADGLTTAMRLRTTGKCQILSVGHLQFFGHYVTHKK